MEILLKISALILLFPVQNHLPIGVTKGVGFSFRDGYGETIARVRIEEFNLKPRSVGFINIFGRYELIVKNIVIEVSGERSVLSACKRLQDCNEKSLKNIKCYNFKIVDCITKIPIVTADEAYLRDGQMVIEGNCILTGKLGRQMFDSAVVEISGEELIYTIKRI
jgi:hypothetical protein